MKKIDLGAAAWTFQEPRTQDWLTAEVPGCSHTDLLAHALIPDPFHGRNELDLQWIEERDWYYRCDFEIDVSLLGEDEIELVFEGLDTVATVLRNGEVILVSDNMFHRHRVPVKPWLRPGSNRLAFTFSSVINYLKTQRSDFKVEESNDRDQVLLRRRRLDGDALLSENTVFFAAPRMLDLRPSQVEASVQAAGPDCWDVHLSSSGFVHALSLEFTPEGISLSDNAFDLYPGEARVVRVERIVPVGTASTRSDQIPGWVLRSANPNQSKPSSTA